MHSPQPPPDSSLISASEDTMEILDETPKAANFCPRALRLSNSFASFGFANRHLDSVSIQKWKEGFVNGNLEPLRAFWQDGKSLQLPGSALQSQPSRLSEQLFRRRPSTHRLRTRSLDRKHREGLTPLLRPPPAHRSIKSQVSSSTSSGTQTDSSFGPLGSDYGDGSRRSFTGLGFHLPIERTVLSVLSSSRKSSFDSFTGDASYQSKDSAHSPRRCSSATLSGSSRSTLGTSVDSSPASIRTPYQPRPLLLSTFSPQSRVTSPWSSSTSGSQRAHLSSQLASPNNGGHQTLDPDVLRSRRLAEIRLEQTRQMRQQRQSAIEAKQRLKRVREAELAAISSRLNAPTMLTVDDDDCWSWLSSSAAEDDDQDGDEEDMAVVWRASLDVGRRVPKDRKALGKGHGIRLPPRRIPSSSSTFPGSSSSSSSADAAHSYGHWAQLGIRSLISRRLVSLLAYTKNVVKKRLHGRVPSAILFGSGLMSGLLTGVLWSAFAGRIPHFLQPRLLPFSPAGLGLFFRFIFPQAGPGIHPTTVSGPGSFLHQSLIGGSIGLYAQW